MPSTRRKKTLLIFSQVFVPDPASVGQHVADVAFEMARRGHRVRVYASARGYDDPTIKYPPRETLRSVDVRRLPFSSFGKKSILTRLIGTASFMAQILWIGLFSRDVGGIFFSTSPPMVGLIASLIGLLRGLPTAYWAMDLNPDQLIALGKLRAESATARLMRGINRFILRRASLVIALDRFMADRLDPGRRMRNKMLVMPPWPHEDHIDGDAPANGAAAAADNPFRLRHGLRDAFVVMYSGNHSPSNPLDTLLDAAKQFRDVPGVRFLFVGGGIDKRRIETFLRDERLTNALSLPYQPLSELCHSLGAADVHVVSLGEKMVGIIHPCKAYGAMAAGRPIFYLGPKPSHISDLLDAHSIGWHVSHGDVAGAVETIRLMRATRAEELRDIGGRAKSVLQRSLSQQLLCGQFCDRLERALRLR